MTGSNAAAGSTATGDPSDRRGVVLRAAACRGAEILRLYLVDSGMNTAMDQICAEYENEELELLDGFLRQTAEACLDRRRKARRTLTREEDGRRGPRLR